MIEIETHKKSSLYDLTMGITRAKYAINAVKFKLVDYYYRLVVASSETISRESCSLPDKVVPKMSMNNTYEISKLNMMESDKFIKKP